MRKLWIFIALCALSLPVFSENSVTYLTTEQFRERVFDYTKNESWKYSGERPCIIDFYTTWCGPCKRLAPIMEELAEQYCGQIDFYKVDTERERELAYIFQISSIPQVLYIPMSAKPTLTKGLLPKEQIVDIIENYVLTDGKTK